jgi:general secretion pathway protein N
VTRRRRLPVAGLALLGAGAGAAAALLTFAPAAWLAAALAAASGGRLLLADAQGSVWQGSAVAVLTGGAGSRDASALPGRLHWSLAPGFGVLGLRARHACCINGELQLRIEPGWGRWTITLPAAPGTLGQWPANWLTGLGTPFNTLQPGGWLGLSSSGLVAESVQGLWQVSGGATLTLNDLSSRVSTLETLGSYRLALTGGSPTRLALATLNGPLQLSGSGQWSAAGLQFRGEARAMPGFETALNNLLNIIGRRQGAAAVLSIG